MTFDYLNFTNKQYSDKKDNNNNNNNNNEMAEKTIKSH